MTASTFRYSGPSALAPAEFQPYLRLFETDLDAFGVLEEAATKKHAVIVLNETTEAEGEQSLRIRDLPPEQVAEFARAYRLDCGQNDPTGKLTQTALEAERDLGRPPPPGHVWVLIVALRCFALVSGDPEVIRRIVVAPTANAKGGQA